MGLRDKVVFLAARSEQYLPALVFFAFLGPVDLIIALKLLIVVGVGRCRRVEVRPALLTASSPPMVSNTPWVPKALKRMNYRSFPDDLRPSHAASLLAHIGGSTVEIVLPLVLLFSTNPTVTLLAVIGMVVFHLFILSTFPLAVPLEWNVLFAFATVFLFWGHPAWEGYGVGDISLTAAARRHRRRAAVLPGARQPAARPRVVPAVDAPVRRQLGVGHVGVRARCRAKLDSDRAGRRQHRRPGRGDVPAAGRRDAADHAGRRGGRCTARAPRCSR